VDSSFPLSSCWCERDAVPLPVEVGPKAQLSTPPPSTSSFDIRAFCFPFFFTAGVVLLLSLPPRSQSLQKRLFAAPLSFGAVKDFSTLPLFHGSPARPASYKTLVSESTLPSYLSRRRPLFSASFFRWVFFLSPPPLDPLGISPLLFPPRRMPCSLFLPVRS